MTKSFSKGVTNRITDRTIMIANRLVIDLTNDESSSDDEEL